MGMTFWVVDENGKTWGYEGCQYKLSIKDRLEITKGEHTLAIWASGKWTRLMFEDLSG
jgi:hypothetical protein